MQPPVAVRLVLAFAASLCLWPSADSRAAQIIATNPVGGAAGTNVVLVQTSPFSTSPIGPAGGGQVLSGLDFHPGTGVLFASSGFGGPNPGSLFRVNGATGAATLIGPTGFDAVPGLVFDLDRTLYGSAAAPGSTNADTLIRIDPATGAGTAVGAYGTGIAGMDALAVDPTTGILYGGGAFAPGFPSGANLFTIDRATGAATLLGTLTEAGTGDILPKVLAGLTFDGEGNLYGSLGGFPPGNTGGGSIVLIDIPTLQFTFLGDVTPGSESAVSDIAIFRVPEPSTFLGLGLAAAGLAAWRRRKH
jgi:hypothetical protein